jgi:uncharacterized protein (TIGR04255 family)
MPLRTYDRITFDNSPLRLAIGQVRFPLLFRFNEKPFLAPFQEALQPDYPRVTQEQQAALRFSTRGVEPTGEALWRFNDRDGVWSIVLGESAITLEGRRYTDIKELTERFSKVLSAAQRHLGIEDRSRLGLRFVNEFRSADGTNLRSWAALLNPQLVGFGGTDLLDGSVEHAFQEIQMRRASGMFVVRHGLISGSTIEPRPGDPPAERGPFYLLDIDAFVQSERQLDVSETAAELTSFNEGIYQFFRWAIDGGRIFSQLKPKERG